MRKTFVIALRDYLAAVKTKSFVVSIALMPVLVGGGMLVGKLSRDVVDTTPKKIAVIDRAALNQEGDTTEPATPGLVDRALQGAGLTVPEDQRPLYQLLIEAAQNRNEEITGDDGKFDAAPYEVVPILPETDDADALEQLRLELSDRVRDGDLFAFVEIGPNVVATKPEDLINLALAAAKAKEAAEDIDVDTTSMVSMLTATLPPEVQALQDLYSIRYSSKSTTNLDVSNWIRGTLTPAVQYRKLKGIDGIEIPREQFADIMQPMAVNQRPLATKASDGGVSYEAEPNLLASILVPVMSVFLLFGLIGTAAFPLTTNIIEEKQMRIAEVLLGSVRPFELMLGKLLGGVAISLTLAAIYGAGGLIVALQFGVLQQLGFDVLIWFAIFASLATLMVGAMSVAVGAAVTNLKEAQNLQTPVVLLPMLPALVAINVAQNPQGPLAHIFTWFPLTTPITSVMRIGVRDGMPTAERFLAAGLSVLTTIFLVWLAGRIFRHGMLRSEKAAGMGEMLRWMTRG